MAFYKSHYLKRTIDINTKFPYLEYITYIVTIVGDFSFNFHQNYMNEKDSITIQFVYSVIKIITQQKPYLYVLRG